MDDVTWGALTLTLTVLGALWTWHAFRRRGLVSGLRGLALTLLPVAAYLTGTLRMFTRIVDAVADWAVSLAFNPLVWSGVVLLGGSAALFVVAGVLSSRGRGGRRPAAVESERTRRLAGRRPSRTAGGAGSGDPELDEIEALLRKRGIS